MKNCLKAIVLIALLAFVFTACGEKANTTVFKGTDALGQTHTFNFKSDNTFNYVVSTSSAGSSLSLEILRGTYTGNPKNDETLRCTVTQEANDNGILEIVTSYTFSFVISGGQVRYAAGLNLVRQ